MRLLNHYSAVSVFFILLSLSPSSKGEYAPMSGTFIENKEQGWFYYEEELEPEEEVEEILPEPPKIVKNPEPKKEEPEPEKEEVIAPPPAAPTPAPLPAMSTKWLRKYLPEIRDRAIDNPTQENVTAYLYAQRMGLDKSTNFRKAYARAIANDPLLDENRRSPISPGAMNALQSRVEFQKDRVLTKVFSKTGLFFIFDKSCTLCEKQVDLLEYLERKNGLKVIPISTDGFIPPHPYFKKTRMDKNQTLVSKFGLRSSPGLVLVHPPSDYRILGEGMMTLAMLTDRILPYALDMKVISKEDMQATSMVIDDTNLADLADIFGVDNITNLGDDIVDNPTVLSETLRSMVK